MSERITQLKDHAYIAPVLTNAEVAEKGKRAFIDTTTGKATVTMSSVTMDVGEFAETRTGDGTQTVMIRLHADLVTRRWANDTGTAVEATDRGRVCYVRTRRRCRCRPPAGGSAGIVIDVDSLGVRVASLMDTPMPGALRRDPQLRVERRGGRGLPAPRHGLRHPDDRRQSTVTLPADAFEGTELLFVADGTKNGHHRSSTATPRAPNLTTALTASKRHQVRAVFLNGKWTANAYVRPERPLTTTKGTTTMTSIITPTFVSDLKTRVQDIANEGLPAPEAGHLVEQDRHHAQLDHEEGAAHVAPVDGSARGGRARRWRGRLRHAHARDDRVREQVRPQGPQGEVRGFDDLDGGAVMLSGGRVAGRAGFDAISEVDARHRGARGLLAAAEARRGDHREPTAYDAKSFFATDHR